MRRGRRGWRETRMRRCLVSGGREQRDGLLRFVVEGCGQLRHDSARSLGGRGYWVECSRTVLQTAISRNLFARAARRDVVAAKDLPVAFDHALVRGLLAVLTSHRHRVVDDVARGVPPDKEVFLFLPSDIMDGLDAPETSLPVFRCFDRCELHSVSNGLDKCGFVVPSGGIAGRIRLEAGRLSRFRASGVKGDPVQTRIDPKIRGV